MSKPRLLLGCGILQQEVRYLIEKNAWALDTDFLDSSLHVDFAALESALQTGLVRNTGRDIAVFYGSCHPRMEQMLDAAHTFRTQGQNCVEMLLGRDRFMNELSHSAFFLLEDWALHWDMAINKTFGNKPDVIREIFQLTNQYILCVRTPCSGHFEQAAAEISAKLGLPLRWLDVGLEHLETVLAQVIGQNNGQTSRNLQLNE